MIEIVESLVKDPLNYDLDIDFYNVKVKKFGKEKQVIVYSKPIIKGLESPLKGKTKEQIVKQTKTIQDFRFKALRSFKVSKTRSKNKIYDYSRSNDWEWFVTITFDPKKVDSFNYDDCTKKLSKWLNNIRSRYCSNMKYFFVPEIHKSGRYHFHGLLSDCDGLEFNDSGHVTKATERSPGGEPIYNIGRYRYGFTTATKVKDSYRVSKYIAKYVTKELSALTKGKKRYWASRNCNVPEIELYYNKFDYIEKSVDENGKDHFEKVSRDEVMFDLHNELLSEPGFEFGQEKSYIDSFGQDQFIRYYEFREDEKNENEKGNDN